MKTSVNVMGIQAVNILERIAVTLKAVLRVGKENRSMQVIHDETSAEAELKVFTARDPVFAEERVISEIPEPLWMNGLLAEPKALTEKENPEPIIQRNTPGKKVNKHTKARKRSVEPRAAHLTLVKPPEAERASSLEIRDLRSSPSPPAGTRA